VRLSRTRSRLGLRTCALGLALATGGISSVGAQGRAEPRGGPPWGLKGLRSEQCVRFLVEPGTASKASRAGYRPVRADQDQALHPALRSVLESQPEFSSWTSSSLCFFYVDTVTIGRRVIADKNARKPQVIAVWTLATVEQGRAARRDLVLEMSAGSPQLVQGAEAVKLPIREASFKVYRLPDSLDELHEARMGKTRLVWTGRPVGDSTGVTEPIQESWLLKGASGTVWNVSMSLRPRWSRPLVGVLRVEGKDELARALKGSPIRFVGPRHFDGAGDLVFSR
jgi:hypothetical protein